MLDEVDYASLSLDELRVLLRKINDAIEVAEQRRKTEALAAAEAAASKWGYKLAELGIASSKPTTMSKLAELAAAPRPPRQGVKQSPKYRDPADETSIWSGIGRAPRWFREAIEAGRTPEDMAIRGA